MDIINYSFELMRLIFISGAVFALIYKKRFGVTPGGIIVPGTLAISLASDYRTFLASILSAIVCFFIYKLTFAKYALSKDKKNYVLILMSVLINIALTTLLSRVSTVQSEIGTISLVSSGLIAISAHKYSLRPVLTGTLSVTAVTYIVGIIISKYVAFEVLSQTTIQLGGYVSLGLSNPATLFVLSVVASYLLYLRASIKPTGYLMLPYIATIALSSNQQIGMLLVALLLNVAAIKWIMQKTLIIGLERFVISLLGSYVFISAIDYIAIAHRVAGYRPSPLAVMVVLAVATNSLVLMKMSVWNPGLRQRVLLPVGAFIGEFSKQARHTITRTWVRPTRLGFSQRIYRILSTPEIIMRRALQGKSFSRLTGDIWSRHQ